MSVTRHIPTIFVLFGATGDLVKKKVAPALFELFCEKKLPRDFSVVGMARSKHTDASFRAYVRSLLTTDEKSIYTKKQADIFAKLFYYSVGDFENPQDYRVLKARMDVLGAEHGAYVNTLFFFSVLPQHYEAIFKHTSAVGLTSPQKGTWARLLIEKPFGSDQKTARALNTLLAKLFTEEQIYRIEHYLAKDMTQSVLPFRFGNPMFSWSNSTIESVHISLLESNTADGRGAFYESVGALRDVGQNHLLQMLALIAMEMPKTWDARSLQQARAHVLRSLSVYTPAQVTTYTYRAQYDGYTRVKDVSPNSQVETYYRATAYLKNPRWRGTPFIMESGKGFSVPKKTITIVYKPGMFPSCDAQVPSTLTFEIEPQERVVLHLSTQRPGALVCGSAQEVVIPLPRPLGYIKRQYIDEYKKIFKDALIGEKSSFVSADEVHAMWRFVDPIVRAWKKNVVPLHKYKRGAERIIE